VAEWSGMNSGRIVWVIALTLACVRFGTAQDLRTKLEAQYLDKDVLLRFPDERRSIQFSMSESEEMKPTKTVPWTLYDVVHVIASA
jgi:hypothetical protein